VRTTDAAVADGLRRRLEPFLRPQLDPWPVQVMIFAREEDAKGPRPRYSYYRGDELRLKSSSVARLVEFAAWDIHACVPEKTRDYLLLHSGAVSRRHGDAALIAGPADVGKSSMVAALLGRGFDYLSDELGAIDPVTERAFPFAKLISLAPDAIDAMPEIERRRGGPGNPPDGRDAGLAPADLGASVAPASDVRWLVFPSFDRGGPPRLMELPRAEAVRRMAELSFNLYRYEERGVVLLSRIADRARAFALEGGTITERADLLAEQLI
jgi:hypothetical protein